MLTNKESHIALAASISFCIGFLMACAPEKKLTGSVADLQGTWVASCAYSETTNFYKEAKYVVSGRSISYEGNYYFDALCDNVSSKQMSFYTNLNVGDEVTLDNGTNGNRFSYNVQSYQLIPMDVNVVQTSNDYSYCGVDTWEIEKALDILNFSKQKGAALIKKLLDSAISNAENNENADIDDLTRIERFW